MSTQPELVTVTIDGQEVQAPKGQGDGGDGRASLGIGSVFCYEPRLGAPVGACRMCLCEVEGLPEAPGSLHADRHRRAGPQDSHDEREGLGRPARDPRVHPPEPSAGLPGLRQGRRVPLQDTTFRFGPGSTRMHFPKRTFDKPIPISPLIALDRERCILCYRCALFGERLRGQPARGHQPRGVIRDRDVRGQALSNTATPGTSSSFARRRADLHDLPLPRPARGRSRTSPRSAALPGRVQRLGDHARGAGRAGAQPEPPRVHKAGCATRAASPTTTCARRIAFARRSFGCGAAASRRARTTALDRAEAGLREAEVVHRGRLLGRRDRRAGNGACRIVREGLGSHSTLLPDDWDPGLAAFRAPSRPFRTPTCASCSATSRSSTIPRRGSVAAGGPSPRRGGDHRGPAGDVQVAPGAAAQVGADLRQGAKPPRELRETAKHLRGAKRVALVWSQDDSTGGRHIGGLASDLRENQQADVAVYALPRTPNGLGVAAAWHALGEQRSEPSGEGEIGALIVSGDEAGDDPRVAALAARARFVLATSMFQSDLTAWAHRGPPGTSYLERDGTFVNLEGRRQRVRRAVVPGGPDELEWLARLGERFGVSIDPWAAPTVGEQAELPPGDEFAWTQPDVEAATGKATGPGLELVSYRALFSGGAVERVPQLQFQRPAPEIELAFDDAKAREIAPARRFGSARTGRRGRLARGSAAG